MSVEIVNGDLLIDAKLLSELLAIPVEDVAPLMRDLAITSVCEKGTDIHSGEFRLTFFHSNRRARLRIDSTGHIIQRSVIDYGGSPMPRLHGGSSRDERGVDR
jgi:hypothetical protein